MKPGDTVSIRHPDGFVSLYHKPGPASPRPDMIYEGLDGFNPEVYQMKSNQVGLVISVVRYQAPDCSWLEALVMVSLDSGATRMGWRETTMFEVL
jgi:hypothetical protein